MLEYIWAIAVILDGNSVYRHLSGKNLHLTLLCMLLSVVLFFVKSRGRLKQKNILTGAFFFLYVLLYYLLQRKHVANEVFISMVLIGLPVMIMLFELYTTQGDPYRLFICMANVILVLTVLSLTAWLLGSVLHLIPLNSSAHIFWGRDRIVRGYFGLQYEAAMDTTYGISLYRNQSLFTEAPMFNLWLCISLSVEVFLKERISKARCAVFVLGILSTVSTAGLLFCVLVLGLYYFEMISKGKAIGRVILSLFLVALIPAGLYFAQTIYSYKSTTLSFAWRMQDYAVGWRVFTENPLIGTGFGVLDSVISQQNATSAGYSNSITALLATGGLWITALFVASLAGYFSFRDAAKGNATAKFGVCFLFLYIALIFFARYIAFVFFGFGCSLLITRVNQNARVTWKPPIWLDEDDGKATGIREENVSFAVFDTLIRRSVARPADLFRIMEQNNPNVPEHFAEKRMEAERAAFAKRGARMSLADIYEELLPLYGSRTNDLMALEIQYEIAGCRPVADNIDLVNLCMEHDKNVFLMADTYLPSSVIRRMLDVCGVYHYDRLYVSCEEGACKADGSLFWKVLADQEIRPHELRHIGSDRQGDITEPWRVGVHVKRGKKKELSAVDTDLPEDIAVYGRTLQACIQNCAADLDSDNERLGCETFGPLLAGFTAWLREQLHRDGIQDVYFLAGDGSIMKQAFDALEDGRFRTHALYFPAQTVEQDHEALLAYIRACGMQGRVALVDTGRAAVQKTLENIIAEAELDIQVKGYYVGLNGDTDGMQAAGYLYERGKGAETLEKLSPVMALFDTVFHAQHGPVRRIAMRDGQPVPELDVYEYASDEGRICDEIAILRAYQAGALALVHEMNEAFPGGVPQIPGEAALLPLLRMGTKPTLQEAELWGDFRVFEDGKATLMARPKGLGAYLLHPGQLKRDYAASPWKIGFLRRLSRLPLSYDKIVKNR